MKKLGLGILFFAVLAMNSVVASAQKNQPSDKTLRFLSEMAYAQVPTQVKFKGKVVKIDKKNPDSVVIPLEDARRVIKVGYNSGRAQVCGEEAYQVANYQTMMKAELAKNKWNAGQIQFINKLHLVTVMMTTGQIKVAQGPVSKKETEKVKKQIKDNLKKKIVKKKSTCPKDVVTKIKKTIEAYVDSHKKG